MKEHVKKTPGLLLSLVPVIALMGTLMVTILVFEESPHIPIIVGCITAAIIGGKVLGYSWNELEEGIIRTIGMGMQAILILMIIGAIIGTWILSGIVPTLIFYGLKIIAPSIFLITATVLCAIVSISTGSSWTTAGTVGVALIGIGGGLNIPLPMVAGAVVSGAYFGDKMSPLSDTTNLAPAMAGSTLFDHIRHMIFTTGPSFVISLVLYGILGMRFAGNKLDVGEINAILDALKSTYNLNILLLLPPLLVVLIVILKVPAIPGLIGGALIGAIFAVIFQGSDFGAILAAANDGVTSETGNEVIDALLTRGGIQSMMWTVSLILCALSFGGLMEKTGMLEVIAKSILKLAVNTGTLVAATVFSCIFVNFLSGDQYLAIVIPGRMYKDAYQDMGLAPVNLSRALEDSGTLTSPLCPWNTCGATMAASLGISPAEFWKFAFLNLINPLISIIYGFTGFSMKKMTPEEIAAYEAAKAEAQAHV